MLGGAPNTAMIFNVVDADQAITINAMICLLVKGLRVKAYFVAINWLSDTRSKADFVNQPSLNIVVDQLHDMQRSLSR